MRYAKGWQLLLGIVLGAMAWGVQAEGVVKLGLVAEFSGPFAQYGQQILGGMKAYMKLHLSLIHI